MRILSTLIPIIVPCLFLFVFVNIIKNIKLYSLAKEVYKNTCDETVVAYTNQLRKTVINNVPSEWNKLRNVFQHVNNANMVSNEVKNTLYLTLCKKGCNLYNMKVNASETYREVQTEENIKRSGEEGERNVAYDLKWLPKEYKVFSSIKLENKIEDQEIDSIIIGPKGIFHLEIKNEGGRDGCKVVIDKGGNWARVSAQEVRPMKSPVAQLGRHDRVLQDLINTHFGEDTYKTKGIIVLSNDKTLVVGVENCLDTVIKRENLVSYIINYDCKKELSKEEIDTIYNKLNFLKL